MFGVKAYSPGALQIILIHQQCPRALQKHKEKGKKEMRDRLSCVMNEWETKAISCSWRKKKRKQVSIEANSIPASVMHYNLWVNLIVTDARIHYTHTHSVVSIKRRYTLADNRSPDSKRTVYFLLSGRSLHSCRTCTRWTPPPRYCSQRCTPEPPRNLQKMHREGQEKVNQSQQRSSASKS